MLARFALVLSIGLLVAQPALACSCLCESAEPSAAQKRIEKADYIFRGKVVLRQNEGGKNANAEEDVFRVRLSRILKGATVNELTLHSPPNGPMCGVGWQRGETQDVIAFRDPDGKLNVNLCAQACAAEAGVFKLLEKGGRPVP
jgi:hypothetical protein